MGKALGGGLPISLVAAPAELMDRVPAYKQTSTFSGHPMACAAGLAVLEIIQRERLPENAAKQGEALRAGLERLNRTLLAGTGIHLQLTGRGLMLGARTAARIPTESARVARELSAQLQRERIIALLGGTQQNVIKITPPLILTTADVELICSRFETALGATAAQLGLTHEIRTGGGT